MLVRALRSALDICKNRIKNDDPRSVQDHFMIEENRKDSEMNQCTSMCDKNVMKVCLPLTCIIMFSLITCTNYACELPIIDIGETSGHFTQRALAPQEAIIDLLIMHYTEENLEAALNIFKGNSTIVSTHYIIGEAGTIFRNIAECNAARHAGNSYWNGITGSSEQIGTFNLNLRSLGIEHINLGYKKNEHQASGIYIFDRDPWIIES